MGQHAAVANAFWTESERRKKVGQHSTKKNQHGISAGRSRGAGSSKHQHALADSSSAADLEDSEDVDAAGPRKRHHAFSAGGSRKAGSRKRQDAVVAAGSRKKELHKLARSYVATGHTPVTPMEMRMIDDFLASVFPVYGCEDGTCSVVVHTLTTTNVMKKEMKLPRRAVSNDLALSGTLTLRYHPTVKEFSRCVFPEDLMDKM